MNPMMPPALSGWVSSQNFHSDPAVWVTAIAIRLALQPQPPLPVAVSLLSGFGLPQVGRKLSDPAFILRAMTTALQGRERGRATAHQPAAPCLPKEDSRGYGASFPLKLRGWPHGSGRDLATAGCQCNEMPPVTGCCRGAGTFQIIWPPRRGSGSHYRGRAGAR